VDSIRPESIVDAQLGYTFQTGALSDLNILLQVDNLTDAAYVTTQTVDGIEALKERHAFGRQYLLGASYKF
jgi:iron complex outermembrane receptor protein